ncbi:hypothetical protein TMatcc_008324 [Talaromyces marneffei ATCC 18224]|uniref:uncharacterized protein n=1 Tax=Talaromyces marneffei TaxID=37727 RepID=UPI0012A831B3|nr:uncharacterized protein EYB26_007673 [Talaromyces marneffei]KAE8550309.1 hypothetical protein EYB25_006534 [Talaromyces marneffei]QGA19974.1 hypothetical protein EYB26_007673 [Talaromyces marneffei]
MVAGILFTRNDSQNSAPFSSMETYMRFSGYIDVSFCWFPSNLSPLIYKASIKLSENLDLLEKSENIPHCIVLSGLGTCFKAKRGQDTKPG